MRGFGYKELHKNYISNEYYLVDPTSDENNGVLQMGEVLKVTINCNYDLGSFPFDYQECDFSLFDVTYAVDSVIFNESRKLCYKGKCNKTSIINLPQQYGIPYNIAMIYVGVGNYTLLTSTVTCSTIIFSLQRNSIALLLGSFYIPTGLFGFLSMASYIMNPDAVSIITKTIFISAYLYSYYIILPLPYRMEEWGLQ